MLVADHYDFLSFRRDESVGHDFFVFLFVLIKTCAILYFIHRLSTTIAKSSKSSSSSLLVYLEAAPSLLLISKFFKCSHFVLKSLK